MKQIRDVDSSCRTVRSLAPYGLEPTSRYYVACVDSGTLWGVGATREAAEADALAEIEECGAEQDPEFLVCAPVAVVVEPAYEYAAESWWAAARAAATDCPAELVGLIYDPNVLEARVSVEAWVQRLQPWCAALPGWEDGPEYAREALYVDEFWATQTSSEGA